MAGADIPARIAASFAATTGLERDDLLQEALLAAWRSEEHYDPELAAWSTYSTHVVTRRLCSVAERHRRHHPDHRHDELGEHLASPESSPEDRMVFLGLIRQLPEDARAVVSLALSDAQDLLGLTPRGVRAAVRAALGWPAGRADAAIDDVVRLLLRGELMVRRT